MKKRKKKCSRQNYALYGYPSTSNNLMMIFELVTLLGVNLTKGKPRGGDYSLARWMNGVAWWEKYFGLQSKCAVVNDDS